MRLTVGKNADLSQIRWCIISSCMLSSRSGFGVNDDAAVLKLLIWDLEDLLEVKHEWILLMENVLNCLQNALQQLLLVFGETGRYAHVGKPLVGFKV